MLNDKSKWNKPSLWVHNYPFLPLDPLGWRGIVTPVWAGGWQICGTYISETAGQMYTLRSSMELSKPIVVQHYGPMALTLNFQGQMLKKLYHRNRRADWHETKEMWIDKKWDTLGGFELDISRDLDLVFSRSNFEKAVFQEWESWLTWNERDISQ